MSIIEPRLVRLDAALGTDKESVIRALAGVVADSGRTSNADGLAADALAREATSATGLPGGIAIPHCRTTHVQEATLAFARLSPKTDFGAKDGPADLAFLIAAPEGGNQTHLQLLTKLARALVKKDFTDALRAATDEQTVVDLVEAVVNPAPAAPVARAAAAAAPAAAAELPRQQIRHLVAVTACPTGIAHTYMAAEALEAAAVRAGVDLTVETQGSVGAKPMSTATIAGAEAVIFAADVGIRDRSRFAGKPLVASGVKRAIDEPDVMIREAISSADDPSAPRVEGDGPGNSATTSHDSGDETLGLKIRRVLMTGVSYMIPFVAAGGLLIALSFLLGGYEIVGPAADILQTNNIFNLPDPSALGLDHALFDSGFFAYVGALFFAIGSTAFKFLVPALAGYIAYGIADRPGIAPGFIMGALAIDLGGFGTAQSGFLGGIIGGVMAGVIALYISRMAVPAWARGLMPVLVIPLFATLISGVLFIGLISKPLGQVMTWMNDGLTTMSENGAGVLLGVVLGAMMAFDMGGPLNKTAYLFATAGLASAATTAPGDAAPFNIMAAVMLAGMVPPLALALATVLRKDLFTPPERENGKAAWALGASFITEGAIPFAAADPLRVVPAIMAGSAVTGGLAMALDVGLRAPHGGIFVLFAVTNIPGFLISLVAGTLVAAAGVIVLKARTESHEEIEELAAIPV